MFFLWNAVIPDVMGHEPLEQIIFSFILGIVERFLGKHFAQDYFFLWNLTLRATFTPSLSDGGAITSGIN